MRGRDQPRCGTHLWPAHAAVLLKLTGKHPLADGLNAGTLEAWLNNHCLGQHSFDSTWNCMRPPPALPHARGFSGSPVASTIPTSHQLTQAGSQTTAHPAGLHMHVWVCSVQPKPGPRHVGPETRRLEPVSRAACGGPTWHGGRAWAVTGQGQRVQPHSLLPVYRSSQQLLCRDPYLCSTVWDP